jgi:tRNA (cytidine/uridine-2'-O-)-methyltransferase
MEIILYEPEIPQNTGNIVRLAAATGCGLHLIEPLGFFWNDRYLKRSGLDYWELAKVEIHPSFHDFLEKHPQARPYYATTKSGIYYHTIKYNSDDFVVFGPETRGLPPQILERDPKRNIRLPMLPGLRSLNLSNSVAIITYEVLRQQGFSGLI